MQKSVVEAFCRMQHMILTIWTLAILCSEHSGPWDFRHITVPTERPPLVGEVTSIQEWLLWKGPEAIVQVTYRPVLSSERELQNNRAATV
jgi:hypothetical protein